MAEDFIVEWLNIISFGALTIWNIVEIVKGIITPSRLSKKTEIIFLNRDNDKVRLLAFVIGILIFIFYIKISIDKIIDMNKYEIPLLTRIQTSSLMLKIFLFSLMSRAIWRDDRCNFFFEDGIVIKNKLIFWEQIKNYKTINSKIEINYITKAGYEERRLIKKNKNSKDLLLKLETKLNK